MRLRLIFQFTYVQYCNSLTTLIKSTKWKADLQNIAKAAIYISYTAFLTGIMSYRIRPNHSKSYMSSECLKVHLAATNKLYAASVGCFVFIYTFYMYCVFTLFCHTNLMKPLFCNRCFKLKLTFHVSFGFM